MHNEALCLLFRFSCVFIAQIIDAVCKFSQFLIWQFPAELCNRFKPLTSNPQPKPSDRFYSRYVLIKTNRALPGNCHYPKKPGNTLLSGTHLSILDIKTKVESILVPECEQYGPRLLNIIESHPNVTFTLG